MTIQIKQVRSGIGRPARHKRTLEGLGLRRIGHTVEHEDVPSIRGMIDKISHLVEVTENS
jgi:large subunit ribosomal protein L30